MAELFEQIKIGNLLLKNRLVMPPMATSKSDENDGISDEIIDYYVERARFSKIGLIIMEHSYVDLRGKAHEGQLSMANESNIANYRKLTEAIHKEGVKIIAQINHAGAKSSSKITGLTPVSASAVNMKTKEEEIPLSMNKEQMADLVNCFVKAAKIAKDAGFDGVEIHSAHGYLLNQFYSPLSNKREDEYGPQNMENRTRLHREIITAVRDAMGDDFMISIRLGGCDYKENGSSIEDCVNACILFEKSGVDMISLSGGLNGYIHPTDKEYGYFKDMSIPVKKAVKVPVLLTGGITKVDQAEDLIQKEAADLIGVARAILKDAHWADEKEGKKQ